MKSFALVKYWLFSISISRRWEKAKYRNLGILFFVSSVLLLSILSLMFFHLKMLEAMICLHEDICLIGEQNCQKRRKYFRACVDAYFPLLSSSSSSSSSVKHPISFHVLSCFVYLLAYFANKLFFEDGAFL